MSRFIYTTDMVEFLDAGYKRWRVPELTQRFNKRFCLEKSEQAIKSCITKNKIKAGRPVGYLPGERPLKYTDEQVNWLKLNYKLLSRKDLVIAFNHVFELNEKFDHVNAFLKNHGISSGRTGRFEKGSTSWNKGKSFTAGGRSSETRFKKGQKCKTAKPLGYERVCAKDGYVYIKVAEKNLHTGHSTCFRLKHRVIWEQVNGPIPKGMALLFKDGDKQNCSIENLILVSRGQLAVMNKMGLADAPAEYKETAALTAELIIKTNQAQAA